MWYEFISEKKTESYYRFNALKFPIFMKKNIIELQWKIEKCSGFKWGYVSFGKEVGSFLQTRHADTPTPSPFSKSGKIEFLTQQDA